LEARFASPQQYTPRPLAEKILSDRSTLEGERKQVTVLFADVAGFTAMVERLDPEECYTLMQRCFDLMLEEVHRYEGTVTQFLGDGILGLFGAPIAHEDHAQRAVHAALGIQHALSAYQQELREQRGIHFQMRIGLNSGPVVVATIGTDLHMTYTAVGDTVNLGSRMEGLAEPGTVLVSENTHRLVSGYFDTRELGQHQVQGKEQAVGAYEVLRPRRWRSRVELSAERGLTPLVGRQLELRMLRDRAAAARSGNGQIVFMSGEAGIGKSRLLHELRRSLDGEELRWLEGRCVSFGRDIAYYPVIDLLKHQFEIQELDTEAEIIRKVESGVSARETELAPHQPYLKYLLTVNPGDPRVATMDPQMRKAYLFDALRALLNATSDLQPLVVSVEDLHWIDSLSEQFLVSFADTVSHHPILLILTARRGYEYPADSHAAFNRLDLQSLSEAETAAVARGLLGAAGLPAELQELIYRKAEGNPFFVEEVAKSLLEVGAIRRSGSSFVLARRLQEIVIPDTVQDVIMARLDRLPEEPKRTLQTASVIGREFAVRLLERTVELQGRLEEYLQELQSLELIYERSLYPELAFMFKHALTHDVAYHSLLLSRRKLLHRLVGAVVEELYRDHLGEQYEVLAYHFEHGEAWDKALEYLQKSGDKALAAFASPQALAFYDRARAAVERSGQTLSPERAIALCYGSGRALALTNQWDQSADSFRAMLRAAEEAGDRVQEGLALIQLAHTSVWGHRFDAALEYAGRARQVAQESQNPAALEGALSMSALVHVVTGNLRQAHAEAESGLQTAREAAHPVAQGWLILTLGALQHFEGSEAAALALVDEAVQIGRQQQEGMLLNHALASKGLLLCACGEYDQAIELLTELLDFATRIGDLVHRVRALNLLGTVYLDLCHWELALQYNSQGATEARDLDHPEALHNPELNLGNCYMALGQLDEAQRMLESVQAATQRSDVRGKEALEWRYTQYLHSSLGELWLVRGDVMKVLEFADLCLTAAQATRSRRNIAKGRRLRGEAFLAQGRLEEAEAELEEALQITREVGNPPQIWKTLAVLARLRQAQSRPQDAVAAYREALAVVEGVATGLADPRLRETFLTSREVSALREASVPGQNVDRLAPSGPASTRPQATPGSASNMAVS
jgi:class 3 adenylate cyclase